MLHGKIEINHVEIGAWSACRAEPVFTDAHWYDCEVQYRNIEGYPKRTEFRIVHWENYGALVLMSQVISTAITKMK